jgi:predicted DNA-binding transcriptional regulator AlpA
MSKRPCHASELPDVLKVDDLARLLGISSRTVYERIQQRSWPFSPIPGFTNRWSKAHVLAVIDGQSGPPRRSR